MPKLRNGSKGDSNPGSLDCESDILMLSYRPPHCSNNWSNDFGNLLVMFDPSLHTFGSGKPNTTH